jgi:peptide/nickel transport system substrate-binding protein
MRPTGFPLLAASSLLFALVAGAEARPHYGGTIHVAMRAAPTSLEPSEIDWSRGDDSSNLLTLLFDALITVDEHGQSQPGLAGSWHADPGNQRWRFLLRPGVTFSDGKPLTADNVAASLRIANATWKVFPEAGAVVIERDSPAPYLPAELALPRNSIVKRESGKLVGTGPFVVSQWVPSKELSLRAREDYWDGRPFLDSIEIDLAENFREQMNALDLGKAQLIAVAPEQAHSAAIEGRQVARSAPAELMALVFSQPLGSAQEQHLREALTLCIDRESLNKVVLQGEGEPAGGLLPNWMTGYEFLFPSQMNLTRAREERSEVPHAGVWTVGFDPTDPVESVVAERLVLNASDAGLRVQLATGNTADMRLVRLPLPSLEVHTALTELAAALGLPQPKYVSDSIDDVYSAENALLQSLRVIPLLHSRSDCGIAGTLRNWTVARDGKWRLQDVWLSPVQVTDKP